MTLIVASQSQRTRTTATPDPRRLLGRLGLHGALLLFASDALALRPLPPPGGDLPIEIEPVDPAKQPPAAPAAVTIGTRTASSVELSFRDASAYEDGYQLQRRQVGSSAWQVRRSYGALTGSTSFTDTGLVADTQYCYRVRAFNKFGQRFSPERCVFSRDGRGYRAWRTQLRVRVADREDAGTDDSVFVRLNGNGIPSGNITYLDYGRDDFERGSEFTYDLNLDGIDEIGDITQIALSKEGDDGLCVQGLSLLVNGIPVFDRDLGSASNCQWLDTDSGSSPTLTVNHAELRAHPAWSSYNHTAAQLLLLFGVPNAQLVSRIESMVGDSLHGTELYWGDLHGPAVEVSRGCPASATECSTAHVDLDLSLSTWLPDPEVDVDFDLDFVCSNGGLSIVTSNLEVDADSAWYWEVLSLGLIEILDSKVRRGVEGGWQEIAAMLDVGAECRVNVTGDGSLQIEAVPRQGPAPTGPGRPGAAVLGVAVRPTLARP
jgi:hypothetical protein